MPAPAAFEYAVVRVVPRVEREEFINVGALLFYPERELLCAKIELDEARLRALFPEADVALVREHLDALELTCQGGGPAAPLGLLSPLERWRWLVAPRSTIVQTSAPHPGLSDDPARAIERVLERSVRLPRAPL